MLQQVELYFHCVAKGEIDSEVLKTIMSQPDEDHFETLLQQEGLVIVAIPVGTKMFNCVVCGTAVNLQDDEAEEDFHCDDCKTGPMCAECRDAHDCGGEDLIFEED
jgi:hypothetical protein